MKPYVERLADAVEKIKMQYPALWNTAKSYKEGRNVLLNVLQREANVDKAIMAKYLNDNTDIHYASRRKKSLRHNK